MFLKVAEVQKQRVITKNAFYGIIRKILISPFI